MVNNIPRWQKSRPSKCLKYPEERRTPKLSSVLGYFRRFVKDYAAKVAPLSDLTGKAHKWSEMHVQSFKMLKEALQCDSVLAGPDYAKNVHAADKMPWIGEVLSQDLEEDKDRPVAYFFRKLKKAKRVMPL